MVQKEDPNTWSAGYVSANRAECVRTLRSYVGVTEEYLRDGDYHHAAMALKRLNLGLIKLEEQHIADFGKEEVLIALMLPQVTILGLLCIDASESYRRDAALTYAAKMVTEDDHELAMCCCFEPVKNNVLCYIKDLRSGMPLDAITRKYDFPGDVFSCLRDLDRALAACDGGTTAYEPVELKAPARKPGRLFRILRTIVCASIVFVPIEDALEKWVSAHNMSNFLPGCLTLLFAALLVIYLCVEVGSPVPAYIAVGLLVASFLLVLFMWLRTDRGTTSTGAKPNGPSQTETESLPPQDNSSAEPDNQTEPPTAENPTGQDGFIFPDSDTQVLSQQEIQALSDSELTYAINEIYARHGYLFQNDALRTYYEQFDWYAGQITPEEFSIDCFNPIELENWNLLLGERGQRRSSN